MTEMDPRISQEQAVYARWLDWGTHIGLVLLTAAFLAYAFALLEPQVAVAELPRLWGLPVDRYVAATGSPTGWGWITLLGKGDYLNLAAIALLGLVTIVCYLRIVPILLERGERLQAAIAIAQVVVLAAAASGLFTGGH